MEYFDIVNEDGETTGKTVSGADRSLSMVG